MHFSKSKYCGFYQCPKITWLKKNKPEEFVPDEAALGRMASGNELGDLAMGIFGDFVETTTYTDDKLDIPQMIEKTKEYMAKGEAVICEASFEYDGLYCAVDILKKEPGGYSIYEVKSSTHEHNFAYIVDVSYQKYVLEKCGVNIVSVNLVTVNNDYVFDGTLKLNELFKITNVDQQVADEIDKVEPNLIDAEKILEREDEPNMDISVKCHTPYVCGFWKYCTKHIPEVSVFNLYRTDFQKKLNYYYNGIITMEDLANCGEYLGDKQNMQILHATSDLPDHIDAEGIKKFLGKLSYPLYFLDFETMQLPIPQFVGTKPYQQIPFQYSLHYIESMGGELKHKEFLAESGEDPRRAIAESLCRDIPQNVCVLAYNKGFESGRLSELAETFPDLKDHLLNIAINMKDLIDPFRDGYVYNRRMGGSFSIKSVLPALFPNAPELDYHNLDGVHNGGEAMSIFPKIKDMSPEDRERARNSLLKYCELDTFAMVKIFEYLVNAVKE
ncbi:MAG: DUF2779 domain-containing protein [Clostridiales bacterium]|nr:DUF2779 domain-containing protein [Clostridiales bacterium]